MQSKSNRKELKKQLATKPHVHVAQIRTGQTWQEYHGNKFKESESHVHVCSNASCYNAPPLEKGGKDGKSTKVREKETDNSKK